MYWSEIQVGWHHRTLISFRSMNKTIILNKKTSTCLKTNNEWNTSIKLVSSVTNQTFLQNSDMNIVLLVNVHGQQYFIVAQSWNIIWCLRPLVAIFQLYCSSQFKKTTKTTKNTILYSSTIMKHNMVFKATFSNISVIL